MGVPCKRFEALQVLTVSSKRGEARRIMAEYFFSHWLVLRAPDSGGVDDTCVWNKHQFIQRHTIQNFRGAHQWASIDQTF
jgi:hypothetical protein